MNLAEFVRNGLDECRRHNYSPTRFEQMWAAEGNLHDGLVRVITRLVGSPTLQSGLEVMVAKGIEKWSFEQAVLDFPEFAGNAGLRRLAADKLKAARLLCEARRA